LIYNIISISVIVAVNAVLSLMPAKLAKGKGYGFSAFWCLGIFLTFITAFMVAESMEDKRAPSSDWVPENGYARPAHTNIKDNLGYIPSGLLLAGVIITGAQAQGFLSAENILNVLDLQFGFYAAAALSAALTMRAKGPDISFVPLAVLSGYIIASGGAYAGAVLALGLCLAVGVLNGIMVTMTNMPAVIATLVTGAILKAATLLAYSGTGNINVPVIHHMYFLPVIAAVICVSLACFTKLRLPKSRHLASAGSGSPKSRAFWRRNMHHIAAYTASAAIACAYGYFMTARLGAYHIDMDAELYAVIALVFFAVSSVRLRHSKWSVIYALVPALCWTLMDNAMAFQSMPAYYQMLLHAAVILVFSIVFFISRLKMKIKIQQL
jgi:ribose/xylose/arabinose/galactoside ABC-type transport system permease subunit